MWFYIGKRPHRRFIIGSLPPILVRVDGQLDFQHAPGDRMAGNNNFLCQRMIEHAFPMAIHMRRFDVYEIELTGTFGEKITPQEIPPCNDSHDGLPKNAG